MEAVDMKPKKGFKLFPKKQPIKEEPKEEIPKPPEPQPVDEGADVDNQIKVIFLHLYRSKQEVELAEKELVNLLENYS